MSYCVNCGVELEKTIKKCPLCGTEVQNPRQKVDTESPTPYPKKKADIEPVDRKETALILTIMLSAPSIGCAVMNFLILRHGFWSLYVIGACVMLWTFIVPALLLNKHKLPNIFFISLDTIVIIAYIYIFVLQFGNKGWFQHVAIPLTVLIAIIFLVLLNVYDYFKPPILVMTIIIITAIGIFCIGAEIILNLYFNNRIYLFWSLIVAVCCFAIIVPLSVIVKYPKFRNEVRRRMHI